MRSVGSMQKGIKYRSLINNNLEHILIHISFSNTEKKILQYLTEKSLQNEEISEYHLATDVLGKNEDCDPAFDSAVRVNVRRLRLKLKEY